jgi:aerotaxis receptor
MADMTFMIGHQQPWTGVIKNRRKNGQFYWVRLNIMPIFNKGRFTGSLMAHTQATREEIAAVQEPYRLIREGRDRRLTIRNGRIVRWSPWRALVERAKMLGLGARIWAAVALLDAAVLVLCAALLRVTLDALVPFALGLAVVSGLAGAWLTRTIVKPLRQAARFAYRIAACDLSQQTTSARGDEIGWVVRALAQTVANMRATVSDVRDAARVLEQSTSRIAQGAGDLSARAEVQADSLRRTTASMEQVASNVARNAEAVKEVSALASSASRSAAAGGEVVGGVVDMMAGITQSSGRIGDIISVIDAIAFQTNILALNAPPRPPR